MIWCYLTLQAIRIRAANMLNLSRSGFNQQTLRISPTSSDVDMGVVQRHTTKIEKLDGWIDALTNFMNPSVKKNPQPGLWLGAGLDPWKASWVVPGPFVPTCEFRTKKGAPIGTIWQMLSLLEWSLKLIDGCFLKWGYPQIIQVMDYNFCIDTYGDLGIPPLSATWRWPLITGCSIGCNITP
jgi:hypothetical protein